MDKAQLTFLGAARTVTGSKYLVQFQGKRILVDCGLFQGKKELRERNWANPPFEPKELDAIVLTHAHIDHSGYLPLVVKRGFRGPIYCTPPTRDLLELLLPDSAHLQEEEARYANEKRSSKHSPALPLYDQFDAQETLRHLQILNTTSSTSLFPNTHVTCTPVGHILGAAALHLDLGTKRITFSGDIGRYDTPILQDPTPLDIGDLLLCESTYGDRDHGSADPKQELASVVNEVVERKGPLIIPAFAVGRTQQLLYYLSELEQDGEIPILPVFVDSPMAIDTTAIYRRYSSDFDSEARERVASGWHLATRNTRFCRSVEESKSINQAQGARIIISASGMATGGRVLHHLKLWLPVENSTVLFVGYQAEGSRGAIIQSGAEEVRVFGQSVPIRCNVRSVSALSAHADRNELIRWLKSCRGSPSAVKIVHGEVPAAEAFADLVSKELGWKASVADYLEVAEV